MVKGVGKGEGGIEVYHGQCKLAWSTKMKYHVKEGWGWSLSPEKGISFYFVYWIIY